MNTLAKSISQVFKGALKAFLDFPASILCALGFAAVAMVRVQLDWERQEPFDFLLNCLHWALAFGSVFSLTAVTAARSRFGTKKAFAAANSLGALSAAAAFLPLYFFGASEPGVSGYAGLSALAAVRVAAAMLVSLIAFVILAGDRKERPGFAPAFFMTHKAFFIALIYGLAIWGGVSGVAAAVENLVYRDMSYKVYQYIGAVAGFLAFSIFVGYFPDFAAGAGGDRRALAQKQPRFIEILLNYILVPIVLALTVVLFIWAGMTVAGGMRVTLVQLSAIAASYTVGGLWLAAMVDKSPSGLAGFYRRVYPVASLVILAFEAWAVVNSLMDTGLKLTEYIFILIWAVAAAGAVLLLVMRSRAHTVIALAACLLAVVSVLPGVGYQALPVTCQAKRLETLLTEQDMFENGRIVPAKSEPAEEIRAAVTDAVEYLAYARDARLPDWFDADLGGADAFRAAFGFDMTWGGTDGNSGSPYLWTDLTLEPVVVDIEGYRWALNPQNNYKETQGYAEFQGDGGAYRMFWTVSKTGVPSLRVELDGAVVLETDLNGYLEGLTAEYLSGAWDGGSVAAPMEDMSLVLETDTLKLLLVFNYIGISMDTAAGTASYSFDLSAIYVSESP